MAASLYFGLISRRFLLHGAPSRNWMQHMFEICNTELVFRSSFFFMHCTILNSGQINSEDDLTIGKVS